MTYGSLLFVKNQWIITTSPEVAIRVKRLFLAAKTCGETITLPNTPEIAEDLRWFLQRYPHECATPVRALLNATATGNVQRKEAARKILQGEERLPVLAAMATPLRDYQATAVALARVKSGLLIGDDVGLGKTGSAIGIIADGNAPALVVTETHLQAQWVYELAKFAPSLRAHIIGGRREYALPEHEVTVCSYSKLADWWNRRDWRAVVWDEVQALRHEGTGRWNAAIALAGKCAVRIGLSATPVYNYAAEIHNVMECITPGELGTAAEFAKEWGGGYNSAGKTVVKDPVALGAWMRNQGIYIRRTREQVGRELPAVEKITHTVETDAKALESIRGHCNQLAQIVLSGGFVERGKAARELDIKLRKATGIAKAPFVAEFVAGMVDNREQVILAGWHRDVYDIWAAELEKRGIRFALYTGSESSGKKAAAAARFIDGEIDVLIMCLRSGAGLNGLQTASSTVVIGELDWSPAAIDQLIGRLRRDGQENRVSAFYLVSQAGADPIMMRVLNAKWTSATAITDPALLQAAENGELTPVPESRVAELAKDWLNRRAAA